jgi:HK97 family phage major capsid protein
MEALSRRDLSVGTLPTPVQTSVAPDFVPFLRFKSAVGRLGGTLLNDLIGGPWLLPRATGTTGSAWAVETANVASNDASFDSITLTASRISSTATISKQLVLQSQPAIEEFLIAEMGEAIATEIDRVVLNGTGVSPQPAGILSLPVNAPGSYLYSSRSPDVVFGGPASWASVLKFESTLDGGAQVHNDGSYGWVAAPDVRQKWMAVPQVATFPRYLWEQPDDESDGRIAGRPVVSTSQLPSGRIIFGRWSDCVIGTWAGVEILVNPFTFAIQSKLVLTLNLLVAITFKYSSAFVTSSDSASQ